MGVVLSVTQLRSVLQLPERPYEDTFNYDGTTYYDLTQREACSMLGVSGTASGAAHVFPSGTGYQLTAGCVDFSLATVKPDFGTRLVVDYTYSRLGGEAASTAVNNAIIITTQDLGSAFPYGGSTTSGLLFDRLATYGASLVAAREACYALTASDIDSSQKSRRGSVLVDDTKKSADWMASATDFDRRYKQYLTMIRPGGMIRAFSVINRNVYSLLFGPPEAFAFDGVFDLPYAGFADSGAF